MSTPTNLYRAIANGNFPVAKEHFLNVMREKLSAAISTEYKAVATQFSASSPQQK